MDGGQASFEYILTYGWAVLMIIVVIGALMYFGVINPNHIIPNYCSFGQEVKCVDSYILVAGNGQRSTVRLILRSTTGPLQDLTMSMKQHDQAGGMVSCTVVQWTPELFNATCPQIRGSFGQPGSVEKYYANGSITPSGSRFSKSYSGVASLRSNAAT